MAAAGSCWPALACVVAVVVGRSPAAGTTSAPTSRGSRRGRWLLAAALALLALVFTLVGWRALLADLGSPLPLGPASGVLFVGQLGKYLPGSVVDRRRAGRGGRPGSACRGKRTAVAGLLSVAAVSALAGLASASLALPALLRAGGGRWLPAVLLVVPVGAGAAAPAGARTR